MNRLIEDDPLMFVLILVIAVLLVIFLVLMFAPSANTVVLERCMALETVSYSDCVLIARGQQ